MAATGHDGNGHGADGEGGRGGDCSFVWDDASQLYYHASSGFYHDPKAGWYYSTRDGLYYRYVDGQYLLWKSDEGGDNCELVNAVSDTGIQGQSGGNVCVADDGFGDPSPPSDWLEETLINFYLRGYSTEEANACSSTFGTGDGHDASGRLLSDRTSSDSVYGDPHSGKPNEIEEDKNIAEDVVEPAETSGNFEAEDNLRYEENWLAQYGQVVKPEDEILLPFPVVDIWDWRLVEESGKKTNHVSRLVGKLVKQSMKLHPSVPAGGGILKTARICEVHLDLVRAATGYAPTIPMAAVMFGPLVVRDHAMYGYLAVLTRFSSFPPVIGFSNFLGVAFVEVLDTKEVKPVTADTVEVTPKKMETVTP